MKKYQNFGGYYSINESPYSSIKGKKRFQHFHQELHQIKFKKLPNVKDKIFMCLVCGMCLKLNSKKCEIQMTVQKMYIFFV